MSLAQVSSSTLPPEKMHAFRIPQKGSYQMLWGAVRETAIQLCTKDFFWFKRVNGEWIACDAPKTKAFWDAFKAAKAEAIKAQKAREQKELRERADRRMVNGVPAQTARHHRFLRYNAAHLNDR